MARVEQIKNRKEASFRNRYFSVAFKVKKVREIERNLSTVREVAREYSVSVTSVYRWIYKYSAMRKKGLKQVVEAKSDTRRLAVMKEEIKEMHQLVGQKQIEIEFLKKMIELAEQEYGIDIKKKFTSTRFDGSGPTVKNMGSK